MGAATRTVALILLVSKLAGPTASERGESLSSTARPPPLLLVIYRPNGHGYAEYLSGNGFRVVEAHTTDIGMEQAIALGPDLIVLDFELDGDLVACLKHHEVTRAIPIIALAELATLRERAEVPPPDAPPS
jgi:PleD family two-component response regulator